MIRLIAISLVGAGLSISLGRIAADEPVQKEGDVVKVLTIKDVPKDFYKGKASNPIVIESEDELVKAFPAEETVAAIKKQVDLKKEKILLFGWSGSGQDKLTHSLAKEKVTFQYTRGLTRDLRQHFHAFVLPREFKYEVNAGR